MRVIVERYDLLPWDHGFGSRSLVEALAARVGALTVWCEGHEGARETLGIPEGVRFESMRGEQPRHSRRPRAFQAWVRERLKASADAGPVVSLTPLVAGDVWFPARFPSLGSIVDEYRRSSPYITFLKTKKWIGPRIEAAARVARRERGVRQRALVALDEAGAAHVAGVLGTREEAVRLVGRASGRRQPADAPGLREVMRGMLGVDAGTRVALLAGSRPESAGVRRVMAGLAAARREGAEVELITMGFRQHGFLREAWRAGVSEAVHVVGATARMEALFAAADVVLLPSTPTGPLDEAMVVDALAHGCGVVAGRGAPGAWLVGEGRGRVIEDGSEEAWAAALLEVEGCADAGQASAAVSMAGLVARLCGECGVGEGRMAS